MPEVETVVRQLAPVLQDRTIDGLEIFDPRWCAPQTTADLEQGLVGHQIAQLTRRGKYKIWRFSSGIHLVTHLRMTGAFLFAEGEGFEQQPAHARARFVFAGGGELFYVDPRRFGTATLFDSSESVDSYLSERLGPEPLSDQFDGQVLHALTRGKKTAIKAFLLDQRQVAGVGNIYADEALFRARLHPRRAAGSLKLVQSSALADAVKVSLEAGIDASGATIDDFQHVDGARGSYQYSFLVHRREGEPCPNCGTTVEKLVVAGRGTYVCKRCQPAPRSSSAKKR